MAEATRQKQLVAHEVGQRQRARQQSMHSEPGQREKRKEEKIKRKELRNKGLREDAGGGLGLQWRGVGNKKAGGMMPPAQVLVDVVGFSLLPSPLAGEGLGMRGA
ncbi:hypothetical protein AAW02_01995 [Aeromonas dhakensis]|nr:hypothetical protein AAW03_05940 [Aeromonas dhakensis]PHS90673.1 hypothetical protein AAW02_01995 [Aeromonas dhakensis]